VSLAVWFGIRESDVLFFVLLFGVPVVLALIGGIGGRRPAAEIFAVTLVTPLISGLAFVVFLWWSFRGDR
jgi:hypothetical protein